MENFIAHLKEVIPEKDSLKLVKKEAENYYKQHSLDECFATGLELYQSENFLIKEGGGGFLGRICSLQKYKRIIISERYRESAQKLEGAGNSCNGI